MSSQVILEPHLSLFTAPLSCLLPKETRDIHYQSCPSLRHSDNRGPSPSSLSQSSKCLDPQEPVASSQLSLWMKSKDMLEGGSPCLPRLDPPSSRAVDPAAAPGSNYQTET